MSFVWGTSTLPVKLTQEWVMIPGIYKNRLLSALGEQTLSEVCLGGFLFWLEIGVIFITLFLVCGDNIWGPLFFVRHWQLHFLHPQVSGLVTLVSDTLFEKKVLWCWCFFFKPISLVFVLHFLLVLVTIKARVCYTSIDVIQNYKITKLRQLQLVIHYLWTCMESHLGQIMMSLCYSAYSILTQYLRWELIRRLHHW